MSSRTVEIKKQFEVVIDGLRRKSNRVKQRRQLFQTRQVGVTNKVKEI